MINANVKEFDKICVGSVIQEKEEEFTKSLYGLQQQPKFNLMLFENEIDKNRLCVAEVCIKLCNLFLSLDNV